MFINGLIILVLQLTLLTSSVYALPANTPLILPNLELSSLRRAQLIGPVDPQQELTFTVWSKLRNKPQLDQFISELYDPQSATYQQFLTTEQFNAQYAPDTETMQALHNYFTQQGMNAEIVHSNVRVSATAKQIEQTFLLKINNYRYQQTIVYGNSVAPTIPTEIAPYVSGVTGLSNIPYTHAQYRQMPNPLGLSQKPWKSQVINMVWDSFLPATIPTNTSLQGFTGANLRTTYNLANIAPVKGTVIDGTGQTIVIIDGCGTADTTEIMFQTNRYNSANGLPLLTPANFAVVTPNGAPYAGVCPTPNGWDGEIMLDVEASHTIAPGANIVLVLTNNVANDDVAEAINYILANNFTMGGFTNAYVVSNSWDNTYEEAVEPLDATLQSAAVQGLSINFAAGDCGDQTYASSWTCPVLGSTPSIQYPVSSAYVTAVSGTSLFVDNNWNYAFESGWGTRINNAFYSGSMGGISQYRSFPSWQSSISHFTAGGYNAGTVGQYNKRAIPDIAMLADLYTGLLMYSRDCDGCATGGASLATPLFSGTLTLVNQARALAAGAPKPLGLAAPYFYTKHAALIRAQALRLITPPHQIISGAEPVPGYPSAFQLYSASFSQNVIFNRCAPWKAEGRGA